MNLYKPKYIISINGRHNGHFKCDINDYMWNSGQGEYGIIIHHKICMNDEYLIDLDLYKKHEQIIARNLTISNHVCSRLVYLDRKNVISIDDNIEEYRNKYYDLLTVNEYIIKKLLE